VGSSEGWLYFYVSMRFRIARILPFVCFALLDVDIVDYVYVQRDDLALCGWG